MDVTIRHAPVPRTCLSILPSKSESCLVKISHHSDDTIREWTCQINLISDMMRLQVMWHYVWCDKHVPDFCFFWQYLWHPSLQASEQASFVGYHVTLVSVYLLECCIRTCSSRAIWWKLKVVTIVADLWHSTSFFACSLDLSTISLIVMAYNRAIREELKADPL